MQHHTHNTLITVHFQDVLLRPFEGISTDCKVGVGPTGSGVLVPGKKLLAIAWRGWVQGPQILGSRLQGTVIAIGRDDETLGWIEIETTVCHAPAETMMKAIGLKHSS